MLRKEKCKAKRLHSNKGSVLFFIVAIMSILVIIASAAYYAVNSAGKQVEVRRDSEQSYQSAVALVDLISDYMSSKAEVTSDEFISAIAGLGVNETLVTKSDDGTGFSNIAAGFGNYKITIEKVSIEGTKHIVKITTEVEVDGSTSVITAVGQLTEGESEGEGMKFDKFFTSTGYTSNDVVLRGFKDMREALFLDNEYVEFGQKLGTGGDNNGQELWNDITVAGTLYFHLVKSQPSPEGINITVGNNLFVNTNGIVLNTNYNPTTKRGAIKVGGSLYQSGGNFAGNTRVYVLEDMIGAQNMYSSARICVNGDFYFLKSPYSTDGAMSAYSDLYINGDMFIGEGYWQFVDFGSLTLGGNIYINESFVSTNPGQNKETIVKALRNKGIRDDQIVFYSYSSEKIFDKADHNLSDYAEKANMIRKLAGKTRGYEMIWPDGETPSDIAQDLNSALSSPVYKDWNMIGDFYNADGTLKNDVTRFKYEIDTSKAIDWDAQKAQNIADSAEGYTNYGKLEGNNTNVIIKKENFGEKIYFENLTFKKLENWQCFSLFFDTGEGENAVDYKVYLPANCFVDELGKFSTTAPAGKQLNAFRWISNNTQNADPYSNMKYNIFTVGEGSVTFFIAPNTVYYGETRTYVCHYNIYKEIVEWKRDEFNMLTPCNAYAQPKYDNSKAVRDHFFDNDYPIIKTDLIKHYNNLGKIHNNVFLVSMDKASKINIDADYHFFGGFVYAPYMTFEISGKGSGIGMFGGAIAADFAIKGSNKGYVMTIPYDYYYHCTDSTGLSDDQKMIAAIDEDNYKKRSEYLSHIIGSSYGDINPGSSKRAWKRFGYN